MDKSDQRQHVRIDKNFEVSYNKVVDFLRSSAHTRNVSEGGICLPMQQECAVGTQLDLEIFFEEYKSPVKLRARVVRVTKSSSREFPYDVGVQFTAITPAQRRVIREFVERSARNGENGDTHWIG